MLSRGGRMNELTQKEKDVLQEAVETFCGLCGKEDLEKYGEVLNSAMLKVMEKGRVAQLERKAWSNTTGEDVMNALSPEEADEYDRLCYGDDDECAYCGKTIKENGSCLMIKGEWTDLCQECRKKLPEKDIDRSAEE